MGMPGSWPCVHVPPLLVEVANSMPEEPPSKNRPDCAAATIVEPKEYVSSSTIVLCWLVEFVYESNAICVSGTFALAATVKTSAAAPASASSEEKRNLMEPPFQGLRKGHCAALSTAL